MPAFRIVYAAMIAASMFGTHNPPHSGHRAPLAANSSTTSAGIGMLLSPLAGFIQVSRRSGGVETGISGGRAWMRFYLDHSRTDDSFSPPSRIISEPLCKRSHGLHDSVLITNDEIMVGRWRAHHAIRQVDRGLVRETVANAPLCGRNDSYLGKRQEINPWPEPPNRQAGCSLV